ncbi:hypothetical protein ACFCYN_13505 [Gottfriedia sp. NPDC056225]|uniref:hypothetical protein n=1 Tax=Gottfriedia sp. NPDC056225 TaxID=3345751 RepID=UPI0035D8BF84
MRGKAKYVYITHKVKIESTEKLEKLSQLTGKTSAELLEKMIEEMYEFQINQNEFENHNEFLNNNADSDSITDQEIRDAEQRWRNSKEGVKDFSQRMEDWKREEKRKNAEKAKEYKKKIVDWARVWEEYLRNYSTSIKKNKKHNFKYFDPNEHAEVWKKQMREYTKMWHPDYAPDNGNAQKFGEMKAEYDILKGKIPTEKYSL